MRLALPFASLALSLGWLISLLACAPPPPPRYIVQYHASAPTTVGSDVVFTVTRSQAHRNDIPFVVRCPAGLFRIDQVWCRWFEIRQLPPNAAEPDPGGVDQPPPVARDAEPLDGDQPPPTE